MYTSHLIYTETLWSDLLRCEWAVTGWSRPQNWTLKPSESRTEQNLGTLKMEQLKGHQSITVAPHFLCSFFIYFFCTQKVLRSGPSPERCIKALWSPPLFLSPWAGVDHRAMLTYCFILQACFLSETLSFWHQGVWLGHGSLCFRRLYLLSRQSYRVAAAGH